MNAGDPSVGLSVALSRLPGVDLDALVQTGIRSVGGGLPPGLPVAPSLGDQLRRGALAELDDSVARGFAPMPATGAPAGRRPSLVEARFDGLLDGRAPLLDGNTFEPGFAPPRTLDQAQENPDADIDDWTDVPTRLAPPAQLSAPMPDPLDEDTQMSTSSEGAMIISESLTLATEPVEDGTATEVMDFNDLAAGGPMVMERLASTAPPAVLNPRATLFEPPPLPVFPPIPAERSDIAARLAERTGPPVMRDSAMEPQITLRSPPEPQIRPVAPSPAPAPPASAPAPVAAPPDAAPVAPALARRARPRAGLTIPSRAAPRRRLRRRAGSPSRRPSPRAGCCGTP